MLNDREIANQAGIKPIEEIAEKLEIESQYLEKYGKYKAKVSPENIHRKEGQKGKLIILSKALKIILFKYAGIIVNKTVDTRYVVTESNQFLR